MPVKVNEKIKVLLAEDLPSDAELEMRELKSALGVCAFRVVETRDAFLKALQDFQPDLIVSDFKMPSFDGLSALRLAREFNPEIPFIIATGSMNEDTAVECMKAGADDYVIKEHIKRLSSAAINALKQAQARREKNRMQDALNESEKQYRSFFEVALVGIVQADTQGRVVKCNHAYSQITGFQMDELLHVNFSEYTHPEDRKADTVLFNQLVTGKIPHYNIEKRYIHKNGKIIWVRLNIAPIQDDKGNIVGSVSVVEDISKTVEAREALAKSEQEFRSIFEVASVGIVQAEPKDGRIINCNDAYCRITGYTLPELQAMGFSDFTHPDDSGKDWDLYQKALAGEILNYTSEKRYIRKDGSTTWVRLNATIIRDAQGNPLSGLAVCEDITQRKMNLEELEQSEQRFRSFFEVASLGITQTNPFDGRLLKCNNAYTQITGYSQEELLGMTFMDLTHPDDRERNWKDNQEAINSGATAYHYEKRYIKKDGNTIWVHINGAIIRDMHGKAISSIAIVEDITQRKQDEEELLKLQRAMEQSPVLVLITNTEGKIEYFNQHFTEVTGYSLPELYGKQSNIFKDEKHRVEEYHQLMDTLASGATWQGEFQNRKKNGELYWERSTIAPVRNKDGVITSYIDMKEDISERKKAEEELHTSESKFRSVIETSGDAIVLTDPNGIVIEWNPAAERILRTPRQAAIGQPLWDVQFNAYADIPDTPDAYERLKKSILDVRKSGKGPILNQLSEQELHFKDGSVITIESIAFIFDKSADGWHVGSITRDVSERKKKEEEVRQSETRFRTLFTNMVSGACVDEVIYKDGNVVDYRILDINPAYERILAIKRENVVGKLASEIYAPHPIPFLEQYAQVAETGKAQEFEAFFSPSAKYLHITVSSPAPGRFSTVFSDITERKQAAEALQQKIAELERFHDVTVDRELRMLELKREINALLKSTGQSEKYKGDN